MINGTFPPYSDEELRVAPRACCGEPATCADVGCSWRAGYRDTSAQSTNPKDSIGRQKVDLSLVPDTAYIHLADALMDGAGKYGPFNWRDKSVSARVYVAAARRHLAAWMAREEVAADSGVHHLGHAMACMAIIIDAQFHGCLVDDRPTALALQSLLDSINRRRINGAEQSPLR